MALSSGYLPCQAGYRRCRALSFALCHCACLRAQTDPLFSLYGGEGGSINRFAAFSRRSVLVALAGLPLTARAGGVAQPDLLARAIDACPVFLGELPRLRMEPTEAFRGAVVEVVTAGAGGVGGEPVYLTLGRDVPVQASGGACVADLNAVPRLARSSISALPDWAATSEKVPSRLFLCKSLR